MGLIRLLFILLFVLGCKTTSKDIFGSDIIILQYELYYLEGGEGRDSIVFDQGAILISDTLILTSNGSKYRVKSKGCSEQGCVWVKGRKLKTFYRYDYKNREFIIYKKIRKEFQTVITMPVALEVIVEY